MYNMHRIGTGGSIMFDHRKTERYEFFDEKIEYVLDPLSEEKPIEAELVNCNETGLCILSSKPLPVGQEIILLNFMDYSSRSAVVTWITEYERFSALDKSSQILFKIGLQFSE